MGGKWKTVRLGDYADTCLGKMLDKNKNQGTLHPYLGNKNVRWGRFEIQDLSQMKFQEHEHDRYGLLPGDLIVCEGGEPGRCAIWRNEVPKMKIQKALHRIRPFNELNNTYLHYWFTWSGKIGLLEPFFTGTTIKHLTGKALANLQLPLPPLPEQKAIAHILGSLDDKIELNRRMNATLEGMAQALFKSWFVDFDPVIDNAIKAGNPIPEGLAERAEVRRKALADGTANRKAAKRFPAIFQLSEEMGWIPEGWEVKPIAEQVRLIMGQSPSSEHYNKDGNGLPFHQGVTNYGERFPKHEQYSTGGNRHAEQGDILFSVRAPVGRINISDRRIIIGRGLSAMRHKKNYQGFLVYFLKYIFQKEDSIGSGTIFNAVNKKEMENIPYLVPTDGLAKTFNSIANSLDEKIACNAERTQIITNLRDTLLPKLISGELRIPEAEKLTKEALA